MNERTIPSQEVKNYIQTVRLLNVDWWTISETCDEQKRLGITMLAVYTDQKREEIFPDLATCRGIAQVSGGIDSGTCRLPSRTNDIWTHVQRFRSR